MFSSQISEEKSWVQIGELFKRITVIIFCLPVKTCILGPQKNHLKELVLFSTHNLCFS